MEKYANLFLMSLVSISVLAAIIISLKIRKHRAKLSAELARVENIFDPLDEGEDKLLTSESSDFDHSPFAKPRAQDKKSGAMSDLGFDEIGSLFSEEAQDDDYFDPQDEYVKSNEGAHPHDPHENIIILNIMAKQGQAFMGYDLLQALLAAGLRYGEMSIFHRYQGQHQGSKIIFSLASATEPGIFDMNKMGLYTCKGLTLFMQLRQPHQNLNAFDLLLMTAQQLAEDLDGVLTDAKHEELTEDHVLACKNKVRRFQKQFQQVSA